MISQVHEMFRDVLPTDWVTTVDIWSKRVKLFREYHEGKHRSTITTEMAQLLRIDQTDVLDRLNANYMQKVTDAMNDRLIVSELSVGDEFGQAWVDTLLEDNRWDELQIDLHESYIIDGDTFVMVSWDEEMGSVKLTQEEAYNGDWGVIPIYSRSDRRRMHAAVKVVGVGDDAYKVWVYHRDRVEVYMADDSAGQMTPYVEEGMDSHVMPYPADVFPLVHYANRKNKSTGLGCSELLNAVPLNDVINRTIQSMVAASELSAFQIMYVIGAEADADVTPGMIMNIGKEGIDKDSYYMPQVGTLTQNSPVPFLEVIDSMIDKISDVTSTPIHLGGSSQSGEALKQREIALLAKLRRAMVKIGNRHEDMVKLASRVARVYGVGGAPVIDRASVGWMDAQVRNDDDIVTNAEKTYKVTNDVQLYLENVTPVYGWSEDERTDILRRIQQSRLDVLRFSAVPELNFGAVLDAEGESDAIA